MNDDDRLWALIESAWQPLGAEPAALRLALLTRDPADEHAIDGWLEPFLNNLLDSAAGFSAGDLVDLDRVVERKLHDIDRADIQAATDGYFLYCRGFTVAMGQSFYEAVTRDPAVAVLDGECEAMCYLFAQLHEERFGEWPDTGSGITRESATNPTGWPS
jgi:hypothetical protein